jgi:zinc protease
MIKQTLMLLLLLGTACSGSRPHDGAAPLAPSKSPGAPEPAASSAAAEPWRAKPPAPGKVGQFAFPVPELATLNNGLNVLVARRPGGVVSLSVMVRHGASSTGRAKSGLAALTARMLTEATRKKNNLQLAEAAESLGSTLGDDAGRDYSSISLQTLKPDVERGLSLLAEVVQQPAFRPADWARVKAEWLDGLIAERQSPARLASLVGLRALLGEVAGAPVGGGVSDVKSLSVADLQAFHRRAYAPNTAAIIVCGDVTLAEITQQAERWFGGWQRRGEPPPEQIIEPKMPERTFVLLVDRPGAVQTAVFAAHPLPARKAEGHEARLVLSNLLGGLFTSRINHNLREEHAYTYGARSQAIATRQWGAFVVSTSVKTEVTAEAVGELLSELTAIQGSPPIEPIADAELLRSKTDLINELGAHLEHVGKVAADLQTLVALGLEPDYFARYPEIIRGLSRGAIEKEAELRLAPKHLLIVVVGDRRQIEPGLRQRFGELQIAQAKLLD